MRQSLELFPHYETAIPVIEFSWSRLEPPWRSGPHLDIRLKAQERKLCIVVKMMQRPTNGARGMGEWDL